VEGEVKLVYPESVQSGALSEMHRMSTMVVDEKLERVLALVTDGKAETLRSAILKIHYELWRELSEGK
jgi:hypothetical protein